MFRKTLCGVLMVLLGSAALGEARGPAAARPAAARPAPATRPARPTKQVYPVRRPGPPPVVVNPASTSKQVRPVQHGPLPIVVGGNSTMAGRRTVPIIDGRVLLNPQPLPPSPAPEP